MTTKGNGNKAVKDNGKGNSNGKATAPSTTKRDPSLRSG
jgi:hypothetical protein